MNAQSTRFAERTTRATRENLSAGARVTEDAARNAEQSYSSALAGMRELNVKLIEMAHDNTEAVFALACDIATAQAPSDLAETFLPSLTGRVGKMGPATAVIESVASFEYGSPPLLVHYRPPCKWQCYFEPSRHGLPTLRRACADLDPEAMDDGAEREFGATAADLQLP
jgi:hypothetical protein